MFIKFNRNNVSVIFGVGALLFAHHTGLRLPGDEDFLLTKEEISHPGSPAALRKHGPPELAKDIDRKFGKQV